MSLVVYSSCTIQFVSKDKQANVQNYFERSLLELQKDNDGNLFLGAVDLVKKKEDIFFIPLERPDMYKFGSSVNYPDTIRCDDGDYRVNLSPESRENFHGKLKACLQELKKEEPQKSNTGRTTTELPDPRHIEEGNDILFDIRDLGEYIREGNEKKAINMTKELIKKGVRVNGQESENLPNEAPFRIRIQIDGLNLNTKDEENEYTLKVFPSTKVYELRLIFQYVYDFPIENQYFFVNGHLAYGEHTMDELHVKKNSLFVLFLTEIPLKTHRF